MITNALDTIRVLDLTDTTASACGRFLADLGANVIKLEPPGGDKSRLLPPYAKNEVGANQSLFFLHFNHGKRGITLDLSSDAGAQLFRRVADTADVVIESFAPGMMDTWGIGYESLRANNEKLIFVSITPFGQDGPYRNFLGGESVAFAFSGLMALSGEPGEEPILAPGNLACGMASMHAALAVQVAIIDRLSSGKGIRIDASLAEAALHIGSYTVPEYSAIARKPVRTSHRFNTLDWSDHFKCRDGYVRISFPTLANWRAFREWVGDPIELRDPSFDDGLIRNQRRDLILPYVEQLCLAKTRAELYAEGQERHLAVSPINTAAEYVGSDQTSARNVFEEDESTTANPYWHLNPIFQDRGGERRESHRAPTVGQDNKEIYCRELGLSESELSQLTAEGVI